MGSAISALRFLGVGAMKVHLFRPRMITKASSSPRLAAQNLSHPGYHYVRVMQVHLRGPSLGFTKLANGFNLWKHKRVCASRVDLSEVPSEMLLGTAQQCSKNSELARNNAS